MSSAKKVYVMTGGNIGIGFECAKLIVAQPNVHLILGCRDTQRGAAGVKNLEPFLANGSTVEHKPLDLATFASVRKFATELAESQPQGIHTLILNAGLMVFSRRMTVDNFETNLQVNHLSQFLLVQLLLPLLRKGHATWPEAPSCITFVSSSLHQPGTGRGKGPELTIENIDGSKEFDGMYSALVRGPCPKMRSSNLSTCVLFRFCCLRLDHRYDHVSQLQAVPAPLHVHVGRVVGE